MIEVKVTKKTLWDNNVEGFVFLLPYKFDKTAELKRIEQDFYPDLFKVLKRHEFVGNKGQSFVLTARRDARLVQFFFYGLGKQEGSWFDELENLRRTVGSCVRRLKSRHVEQSVFSLPTAKPYHVDRAHVAQQITVAAHLAQYQFTTYKTKNAPKKWDAQLYISDPTTSNSAVSKGVREGNIIGRATNDARELGNMPGNLLPPKEIAKYAKKVAQEHDLKITVFGRSKATKLGMGGFCAVDAGSEQDGQFIVLERIVSKSAPTIALVGKGVTYDTGGISLKPGARMKGMHHDMSGAAAAINTIAALAQLKCKVNVISVTPCVENMPSGKAGRQDDIITFMNGLTAEIGSTDAEGRLILADALCYAEKQYKPDVMIDIATLTGAMLHVGGHYFSGLMSTDDKIVADLERSSAMTGDRVWALPQHEDFKAAVVSDVADLTNTALPGYGAGSITASWFLKHFVKDTPWAHLDIAGTCDGVPGVSYLDKKNTGAAVRLLIDYAMNYKK